jgi:hypothetical protein
MQIREFLRKQNFRHFQDFKSSVRVELPESNFLLTEKYTTKFRIPGGKSKIAKTTRRTHSNRIIDKQFNEVGGLKFFSFSAYKEDHHSNYPVNTNPSESVALHQK